MDYEELRQLRCVRRRVGSRGGRPRQPPPPPQPGRRLPAGRQQQGPRPRPLVFPDNYITTCTSSARMQPSSPPKCQVSTWRRHPDPAGLRSSLALPRLRLGTAEKLPVLGFVTVPNASRHHRRSVRCSASRPVLGGRPQLEPQGRWCWTTQPRCSTVVRGRGNSLGSSGMETNLAPTMTVAGPATSGGPGWTEEPAAEAPQTQIKSTQFAAYQASNAGKPPFGEFRRARPLGSVPNGHVPPYPLGVESRRRRVSGPGRRRLRRRRPRRPLRRRSAGDRGRHVPKAERLQRRRSVAWFSKSSAVEA